MTADPDAVLLVYSTLPDESAAQQLARYLVETRLAACVNVMAPCTSVYCWEGALEQVTEVPVLIKTTAHRYAALELALRERHPYELPEIVAVPVAHGLTGYLAWVARQTA